MHLTRLRLNGFRRHSELDVELRPGLNVIRGPNESGKSTIQRAIELVLFRRPTFASAELDDLRPWGRPDADPTIEIEFEDGGQKGAIRKVFAGARGTVEMTWAGQAFNDPAVVDQQVAALTGLPSEKFLRATASIHHQELTGLSHDESTLRDRLQVSMSGADKGTQASRKKLEDVIRRYRTEGAKNPGYLKVLRTEVARLGAEAVEGEAALARLEADRSALAVARAARTKVETSLVEQREGAARAERAVQLAARAADAQKRYTTYKRAADLRDEIDRLEASHPSRFAVTDLRETADQLRNLEFNLSELRAEMAAEPDLSAYDVALATPRWRPWLVGGAILIGLGLVALVGGVVAGSLLLGVIAGVVLAALGVGALLMARRQRRLLNDILVQNELRESEIARRLAGRTHLNERIRQAEQERVNVLTALGQPDLPSVESLIAAETEHLALIDTRSSELRGLMDNEPTDPDVATLRDKAAAEADECRHTLAGMGDLGREPDRYLAAYNVSVQQLIPERDAAFQAEANAEARVESNTIDAEAVAASVEALGQAEEALAAAERRLRIYEDILTTLDAAEQGTMKKAARFLEQRVAADIERITGGRYRRLRVDEQTLTFSVYSPELNNWIDVRRLSQGTLDQLYLCARLGIVRQVTEPGTPPLMLDDPFVTFDAERAEAALSLLKDLAGEFQIIYITASDRYDAAADNVVVLPGPTEHDEPEPESPSETAEAISMWSSTSLPPTPKAAPGDGQAAGNGRAASQRSRTAASSQAETPPTPAAPLWPEEG